MRKNYGPEFKTKVALEALDENNYRAGYSLKHRWL